MNGNDFGSNESDGQFQTGKKSDELVKLFAKHGIFDLWLALELRGLLDKRYAYLCPGQVAGADFVRLVERRGSQGTGWFSFSHSAMAA